MDTLTNTTRPFTMWLTLVALSAPILALSVDMNGVVVLLSDIGSDLHVTANTAGSIVTVASVAFAAPLLLIGRAADRLVLADSSSGAWRSSGCPRPSAPSPIPSR